MTTRPSDALRDPNPSDSNPSSLGEAFQERPTTDSTKGGIDWTRTLESDTTHIEKQPLPALGNRKEERKTPAALGVTSHPTPAFPTSSPTIMHPRSESPKYLPASPGRLAHASPRVISPTSSLIFERNVQEDVTPAQASPAIPSHIATENHIPPVLEVASIAITDDHLDPDSVEIVTHAAHQPAAAVVSSAGEMPLTPLQASTSIASAEREGAPHLPTQDFGTSPITVPVPLSNSMISASGSPPVGSDNGTNPASEDGSSTLGANAPTYGSIDTTDVRRLSFISFADVVHAEQATGGDAVSLRDSVILSQAQAAASPLAAAAAAARSPSPMRSPASPSLSAASGAGSTNAPFLEPEGSPMGRAVSPHGGLGVGSMHSASLQALQGSSPPVGNTGGELTIETMRQALENTSSGDLSGIRSSIILNEDVEGEKRTS